MRTSSLRPSRAFGWALSALMVSLLAGCSDGRLPVNPVSGEVRVDGQPAKGASVVFHPVGTITAESVHPAALVDDQGHFQLTTYQEGDGAPAGDYEVAIVWNVTTKTDRPDEGTDGFVTKNLLPDKYASGHTSGLTAKVTAGSNAIPVFDLKTQ
jgi:hypothetical protein